MDNKNNLLIKCPTIAAEWDYEKNTPLSPSEVKPKSNKYAWWKCKQGHSWKTKINNRVSNQTGCPYCAGTLVIPGETDLGTLYPEITKEWDYIKNGDLHLINISPQSNRYVWWKCKFGHEWKTKVCHRTDGRGCPYCAGLKVVIGETDLLTINPSLATEWNYKKNGSLTPNVVTGFSHKKVWWRCIHGHEWQATISSRSNGVGCPVCSGHKVIQGINDLANINPQLAAEWHPTMNSGLTPSCVTLHSNKSVWWQCTKGHVWKTTINNRANGNGCPFCNQQRLIPSETSLAIVKPLLAKEWHPSKNGLVTTHDVPAFDNHKFWWRCFKGHEWQATVSNRSNGKRCPYCSGRLPILGKTDLATTNPKLVKEWHYSNNGSLTPSDVTEFADKKVWWVCPQGHMWQASVASRSYGSGCPYCSGMLPIAGITDLATKNSKLADEWNYTKNKTLSPADVTEFSSKKVWWTCSNGHEWQASVASRSYGSDCPYCSGMLPVADVTDLATKNSKLASEWNYNKNRTLSPSAVTEFSSKKVWWTCSNGHEWEASVASRSYGRGCPICKGRKRSIPRNLIY